ncbi:uncharacterized protein LOC142339352 [Convolutriloba macropyga]|uniref:uncharacterized protein LOC142339352 n=1 Tax=Convolutriloba macropyga TaxID=536237 RepID=UPI003F520481
MSTETDQSQLSNSLERLVQSLTENGSGVKIDTEIANGNSENRVNEPSKNSDSVTGNNALQDMVGNLAKMFASNSQTPIKPKTEPVTEANANKLSPQISNLLGSTDTMALFQQMMLAQKLQSTVTSTLESVGAQALLMNPLIMSLVQTQLMQQNQIQNSAVDEKNSRKRTSDSTEHVRDEAHSVKTPTTSFGTRPISAGSRTAIKVGSKSRLKEPFVQDINPVDASSDLGSFSEDASSPSVNFLDQNADDDVIKSSTDQDEDKILRKGGKEVAKFQCGDCSFVTSKLYVFNQHVATHKNNEKEHECPICKQKFKYKQSVKKHMMKHEGITPYHCKICDYKTNSHSSLEVHQRAHSGEKPFVCESCGMRFAQNSQLRVHIQYHSNANNPYKCELCDYQSPNYYKLTRHMKVHRERPYACDLCKKRFMLPYQLRNHYATHSKTGVKNDSEQVMTCTGCNAVYRDQVKFNYHIKECPKLNESLTGENGMKDAFKVAKKPKTSASGYVSNHQELPKLTPKIKDNSSAGAESNRTIAMTTEITHPNNTVSRILHIPAKNQTQQGSNLKSNSLEFPKESFTSPDSKLSRNIDNLSMCDDFDEHSDSDNNLIETEVLPSKFDLPDDVVVIKPEAAPSGFNTESSLLWDFGLQIPDDADDKLNSDDDLNIHSTRSISKSSISIKSEHSASGSSASPGSANISPSTEEKPLNQSTIVDAIQNQMTSIFDNLLFKAENDGQTANFAKSENVNTFDFSNCLEEQNLVTGNVSNALDLTVSNQPIKIEEQDSEVWDLSKPNLDVKGEPMNLSLDSEPLNLSLSPMEAKEPTLEIAPTQKPTKILSEEEAIIKTNNPERPFKCGYCGKQFIQSSHIRVHLQYHVNASNPFKCPDCSYTSASKYKLNLHVKVHKERRFQCPYCSSKFTLNCRLNQHIKLAHGENLPYKCTLCNVTFSSTNLLSWHVANKHSNGSHNLTTTRDLPSPSSVELDALPTA